MKLMIILSLFSSISLSTLADVVIARPIPVPLPVPGRVLKPQPIPVGSKYKNIQFKGIIRDTNISFVEFLTLPLNLGFNPQDYNQNIQAMINAVKLDILKNKENFNPKLLNDLIVSIGNTNITTDIDSLMYFFMSEAAKESSADLKDMLDEVQKTNQSKKSLREQQEQTSKFKRRCQTMPCDITMADIDAKLEKLKNELDSLNEMSELDLLRLQQAMDRRSKLMEMLSNMLKKFSDTSSSIVQNLK